MKFKITVIGFCVALSIAFAQCAQNQNKETASKTSMNEMKYGGFETREKWGEHLTIVSGCNDCHSPKKMTDQGPILDPSLLLSGHPANVPPPDVNRKEIEEKGLIVTKDLTAWVGPWGISYTANLTSDPTGIGGWQESTFINSIRKGKYQGIESERSLLPPMPWQEIAHMSDAELGAIFAYLKTTKPVNNVVPAAVPPVLNTH